MSFTGLIGVILAAFAVPATAAVAARSTAAVHLESGSFAEFSQAGTLNGRLRSTTARSYDGRRSGRATYCGGGQNGFARGVLRVHWPAGSSVSYGAAFLIPHGFKRALEGEVDLLRWDDYGYAGDDAVYGGIVLYSSDRKARLVRGRYDSDEVDVLSPPFSLPTGRWSWLEVRQHLSDDGEARSDVYRDGRRVASSRAPNAYGTTIDRVRFGIVAIQEDRQFEPLTLWFDRATVSGQRIGPRTHGHASSLPRPLRRGGPRRSLIGGCPR